MLYFLHNFDKLFLPFYRKFFMDFIQNVRDLNISDYISKYVRLKKKGKIEVGCCPFHSEKTPSFTVFPSKNNFKCFGCNESGSIIDFCMKINNLEFMDAAKALATEYNIEIPKENNKNHLQNKITEARHHFYKTALTKVPSALQYIEARGFSDEDIQSFGLGYAPTENGLLFEYLCVKFPNSEPDIKKNLGNENGYDFFKGRIVFPIHNVAGKVVGFQCRAISNDVQPKYLHSSESDAFNKSKILYGLDKAKMTKEANCFLVEGNLDVIRMHQIGNKNTVCAMGTSFTSEQGKILKNYFTEITICFDSDKAGRKAAISALKILLDLDFSVKIVDLPDGHDPDSFFYDNNDNYALKKMTFDWLDYLFKLSETIEDDSQKIEFYNRILGICENIQPEIRRKMSVSKYRKELDRITNTSDLFFKNDIRKQYISCMLLYGSKMINETNSDGQNISYSIYDSMRLCLIENEVELEDEFEPIQKLILDSEHFHSFFLEMTSAHKSFVIDAANIINSATQSYPDLSFSAKQDFPEKLMEMLQIQLLIRKLRNDNKKEIDQKMIIENNKLIDELINMSQKISLFE